jgi:hypothetical protein
VGTSRHNVFDAAATRGYGSSFSQSAGEEGCMSFDEAIELASRDERFMATVYAMNTLLIHKGIYTQKEFESLFAEWMKKEQRKKANKETSSQAALAVAQH